MSSGTTENACACCATRIPVKMLCRQRGGGASIIGCPEFVSPSMPPKAYRRSQLSGSRQSTSYTDVDCSIRSDFPVVTCTYAGWGQYDAATGLFSFGGDNECNGSVTSTGAGCTPFASACLDSASTTQTTNTTTSTGACCLAAGLHLKSTGGSLVNTLSEEDTEADAIARLLAGAGGAWGAWNETGDGSHGTCLPQDCCKAQWQVRTTSTFTFAYNEDQFRCVDYPGTLLPSTNYTVKVEIWRRPGGVGPFVLYQTLEFSISTDGSGDFAQFDGDVPNARGFESAALTAYAMPA